LTYNNFGYDNGGNQTTISPNTVSYDVENRQSGFTSTSNGSATYTYDGDGRRVEKTAGGVTTTYVYDATGNLAAEYSSQPPSMPCQTCYLTSDHLGSTRVITGQTGGLVSRHDFLPFGEELATINRTAAQGYGVADNVMQRYTGQQRDLEGPVLDYFGARYFQGAQGRFTSPDGVFFDQDPGDPQSWNLYSYVRNNPLIFTDPNGRACTQDKDGNFHGDCSSAGDEKVTQANKPQAVQVAGTAQAPTLAQYFGFDRAYNRAVMQQFDLDLKSGKVEIRFGVIPIGPPGAALAGTAAEAESAAAAGEATFPTNESTIGHIFRDAEGHVADTSANRALLRDVANDPAARLGTDKYGNTWSAKTLPNGTQAWTQARGNTIVNAGINETPRAFNAQTGLKAQ
jgi:RHS repeat-associated protein